MILSQILNGTCDQKKKKNLILVYFSIRRIQSTSVLQLK